MEKKNALKAIFWISLLGVLFSGYLSYNELFKQVCGLGSFGTCNSQVLSIPSCVYGFVIYVIVLIISIIGLRIKK